jgi:hypothetical protein
MSAKLDGQTSLALTSSAADFRARTCLPLERARALLEAARDCGVSTLALSRSYPHLGSWLRTSPAARLNGSTRSSVSWTHSAMTAFRAQCRQRMSALLIGENASSLLPTLTGNPAPYSRRRGVTYPGLVAQLPTLCLREKGPGPANKHKGGKDLPGTLGGHLNPDWCLWFMGFPAGWLDVDDAPAFVRSVTRSSRSKAK